MVIKVLSELSDGDRDLMVRLISEGRVVPRANQSYLSRFLEVKDEMKKEGSLLPYL